MADIIHMPKLGFDMKEGTLVRWVKLEGENVQKGDVIAEIETDKATVEVESNYSGVLLKHFVEADSIVPIGDPIASVGKEGEKVDIGSSANITANVEKLKPDKVDSIQQEPLSLDQSDLNNDSNERLKSSPLARKLAKDLQLDLNEITGSGPGGRIIKKDVVTAQNSESKAVPAKSEGFPKENEKKRSESTGVGLPKSIWKVSEIETSENRIPINKLRQAIGRRMVESKQQIPHFYETYSYDVAALMSVREQANLTLPDDQKLSVNDFIIKAVAITLKSFPNLNASLVGNEIIQHGSVHIGVAVSVEGGLLTIVVRDADLKPIRIISSEVKEMATRVRNGKIKPEDVEGSTFSISNLGMYGVHHFSAIINPPEAAILAVSAAKQVPVVVDGALAVGWRMEATISADHRITDGVEAAQFMKALAFQIENPIRLLL
ncbi:MAG: dihydrolipoamide acetyltransferase family protein [Anaerolineaceae bacterium]